MCMAWKLKIALDIRAVVRSRLPNFLASYCPLCGNPVPLNTGILCSPIFHCSISIISPLGSLHSLESRAIVQDGILYSMYDLFLTQCRVTIVADCSTWYTICCQNSWTTWIANLTSIYTGRSISASNNISTLHSGDVLLALILPCSQWWRAIVECPSQRLRYTDHYM